METRENAMGCIVINEIVSDGLYSYQRNSFRWVIV